MSMNLILLLGWRNFFIALGAVWAALGLLMMFTVREPKRGKFIFLPPSSDNYVAPEGNIFINFFKKLISSYIELSMVPSIALNMLGMFCRFWGYVCMLQY